MGGERCYANARRPVRQLVAGYLALGLFKSTGKAAVLDFGLGVIGAVIAGSILLRELPRESMSRVHSLLRSPGPLCFWPCVTPCSAAPAIARVIQAERIPIGQGAWVQEAAVFSCESAFLT
jgi:hypothetical protein